MATLSKFLKSMNTNITILEERKNIYSILKQCERLCLSEREKGDRQTSAAEDRALQLLYEIWEKVSTDLWERGYWNDYFLCGNIVLKCAKTLQNLAITAQLLAEMGWISMEWKYYKTSQAYFQEGIEKYQKINNTREQSKLIRYLGVLHYSQGKLSEALAYYQRSQEIVQAHKHLFETDVKWALQEAELHDCMGEIYLKFNNWKKSQQELSLSLEKYRLISQKYPQYRYYQADPLMNLGLWHFLKGEGEQAKTYYQLCLQLCQEISRTDAMAKVLLEMAKLAEVEGDIQEAIAFADRAETIAKREHLSIRDRAACLRERLQNDEFQGDWAIAKIKIL